MRRLMTNGPDHRRGGQRPALQRPTLRRPQLEGHMWDCRPDRGIAPGHCGTHRDETRFKLPLLTSFPYWESAARLPPRPLRRHAPERTYPRNPQHPRYVAPLMLSINALSCCYLKILMNDPGSTNAMVVL